MAKEDNKTYFLIYVDDDALNYWADELKLIVFNKEKQFLEQFLVEEKDDFEWFSQS